MVLFLKLNFKQRIKFTTFLLRINEVSQYFFERLETDLITTLNS